VVDVSTAAAQSRRSTSYTEPVRSRSETERTGQRFTVHFTGLVGTGVTVLGTGLRQATSHVKTVAVQAVAVGTGVRVSITWAIGISEAERTGTGVRQAGTFSAPIFNRVRTERAGAAERDTISFVLPAFTTNNRTGQGVRQAGSFTAKVGTQAVSVTTGERNGVSYVSVVFTSATIEAAVGQERQGVSWASVANASSRVVHAERRSSSYSQPIASDASGSAAAHAERQSVSWTDPLWTEAIAIPAVIRHARSFVAPVVIVTERLVTGERNPVSFARLINSRAYWIPPTFEATDLRGSLRFGESTVKVKRTQEATLVAGSKENA
jgi:hypothetical protein